jgi:ADP-dependent phosphofructokinase/glucokinase
MVHGGSSHRAGQRNDNKHSISNEKQGGLKQDMNPEMIWQDRYRRVHHPTLPESCTGFNANIDVIIPVTKEFISSELLAQVEFSEFRSRLVHSMEYCTAEEWFISDIPAYQKISTAFSGQGNTVIGGQAGIASVHLASIGIQNVLCLVSCAGPKTLGILTSTRVRPVSVPCRRPAVADTFHLIFEYSPGIIPVAEGVVPRNNRFIVSPVHDPATVLIPDESLDEVSRTIAKCRRAFISGYQYLQTDTQFQAAAGQIRALKSKNRHLAIHIECVATSDNDIIKGFLDHILKDADSAGMNEHELLQFLDFLEGNNILHDRNRQLSPIDIVEGAVKICKKTGIRRLHVHTFGYYVLVLDPVFAFPSESQNALLFASTTVADVAGKEYARISEAGIDALRQVSAIYREKEPGIISVDEYTVVIIPTIISYNITRTTGLGDILSSTAFVADRFSSDY